MIGKVLGDFEITEEIGKGGMGQVYKAKQISLDRDVAIKILSRNLSEVEEFRERFDLEAKVVASLIHENILQVYSKGVTPEGIHYFAMEYVDGEDLAEKIRRGVKFSEAEAINITVQACNGLEAAWKKNIIHRDIKPSNLMVAKNGTIKIADFGLARSLDSTRKLTQTNVYMGTVAYISPEQGEGKPIDHRTDIYSLGIVLYQLLTGDVPFTAETPSAVIYKHVYEAPPEPRSLNPNISQHAEAVVLKAIAKKREDRFQNAVEFREALEAVTKTQLQKEAREPRREAAGAIGQQESSFEARGVASAKTRRRVGLLILAVIVILILGGSGLYASKYGYRAVLSKLWPIAVQEEKKGETVLAPSQEIPAPPARELSAAKPDSPASSDKNLGNSSKTESRPPVASPRKEEQAARNFAVPAPAPSVREAGATRSDSQSPSEGSFSNSSQSGPPLPPSPTKKEQDKAPNVAAPATPAAIEARRLPGEQQKVSRRGPMPSVLVVTSGDQNVSDIIESFISKKLQDSSIPLSSAGEIQALAQQYGRHGIPLNAFDQRNLKVDVLVYVSVNTINAGPLKFYGRIMEQYASTIAIKVIDTATKKVIYSPRAKTVNYTTLNMQDNVDEATEEMISDLSERLGAFWKS
jgi:serine/threonine protein kinase